MDIDTALMAGELPDALDNIERIDRLITIAENRRNGMLREIDRRRAVLGEILWKKLRASSKLSIRGQKQRTRHDQRA